MCPEWVCKEAPGGASAPKVLVFRELRVIVIGFKGLSDRALCFVFWGFTVASVRTSVGILRVIVCLALKKVDS